MIQKYRLIVENYKWLKTRSFAHIVTSEIGSVPGPCIVFTVCMIWFDVIVNQIYWLLLSADLTHENLLIANVVWIFESWLKEIWRKKKQSDVTFEWRTLNSSRFRIILNVIAFHRDKCLCHMFDIIIFL